MPSIKDAVEESIQDNHTLSKCIIFAIPAYYCIDLYINNSEYFFIVTAFVFILLFGFLIKCTFNVRNGRNYILPTFNIFSIFWAGLKGFVALGPIILLFSWSAIAICNFLSGYFPEPASIMVWKYIIWGIFVSFIMTAYLCYAKNFKITDAYNLKTLYKSSVDVFAGVLFMIPQILIVNAILIGPVTYIIWLFFGIPHPIANFFWCMCLILNLAIVGHYLAQVDYEAISGDAG